LALSTSKETICLLKNIRYYWVTAVTKPQRLVTSTTGRSVQLLCRANCGVNITTAISEKINLK